MQVVVIAVKSRGSHVCSEKASNTTYRGAAPDILVALAIQKLMKNPLFDMKKHTLKVRFEEEADEVQLQEEVNHGL